MFGVSPCFPLSDIYQVDSDSLGHDLGKQQRVNVKETAVAIFAPGELGFFVFLSLEVEEEFLLFAFLFELVLHL